MIGLGSLKQISDYESVLRRPVCVDLDRCVQRADHQRRK
jgi:hypothetical protein